MEDCSVDKIWLLKRENSWHCYLRYIPVGYVSWRVDETPNWEFSSLEDAKEFCKKYWPNHHPTVRHDGLFQDSKPSGQYMFGAFLGDLKYRG